MFYNYKIELLNNINFYNNNYEIFTRNNLYIKI